MRKTSPLIMSLTLFARFDSRTHEYLSRLLCSAIFRVADVALPCVARAARGTL